MFLHNPQAKKKEAISNGRGYISDPKELLIPTYKNKTLVKKKQDTHKVCSYDSS